jgi:hypothetical protein
MDEFFWLMIGPSDRLLWAFYWTFELYKSSNTCIQNVSGSHLSPEVGYPNWDCLWFSLVPLDKCQDKNFKLGSTNSVHILSHSSVSGHAIIQCCIVWGMDSVIKYILSTRIRSISGSEVVNMSFVSWLQVQKYVTEHIENLIHRATYISGTLNLSGHFTVFCNLYTPS